MRPFLTFGVARSISLPFLSTAVFFHATINLWYALRRLRKKSPRTLWVDAICINQQDDVEKSFHVAMMKDIFTACQVGILWLGEDLKARLGKIRQRFSSKDARRAIALLKGLSRDEHFSEQPYFFGSTETAHVHVRDEYREHFRCLPEMMHLEWWERIWVLQEASLPPQAIFIHASKSIRFDLLDDTYDNIFKHGLGCCLDFSVSLEGDEIAGGTLRAFLVNFAPFTTRDLHQSGLPISFGHLVRIGSLMKATKPHDTFYGILGLATFENGPSVSPDYSLSVADAFMDAVLAITWDSKSLCMLNGRRQVDRGATEIPTWIPDYLLGSACEGIELRATWLELGECQASAAQFCMPEMIDTSVIKVYSLRIGIVQEIASAFHSHEDFYPTLDSWRQVLENAVSPQRNVFTAMPQAERFWNLILKATMSMGDLEQEFHCQPSDVPWKLFEDTYIEAYAIWKAMKEEPDPSFHARQTFHFMHVNFSSLSMFSTEDGRLGMAWEDTKKDD